MARRTTQSPNIILEARSSAPRLGVVLRYNKDVGGTAAIRQLENGGLTVASTRDFKAAPSVPNDFGGADVQYFERFGICIVRRDAERLKSMLVKALETKFVKNVRPERTYRALGWPMSRSPQPIPLTSSSAGLDRDYFLGYRDGVNHLIDNILGGEASSQRVSVRRFEESTLAWGLEAINIGQSDLTGAGIKVAVLDTGFDDSHPDFRGRAITKKNFASNSSDGDMDGHGTHCVGTACGPLRPANGPRYGVAYEAEIFAGKVLGDDGFGTDRSVIAGIEWALDQGCQVISMSLGAASAIGDQPNDDYERIGQVCLDSGSLIVAAAGNESSRPGLIAPIGSPANASTIMAVGAVDRDFAPGWFSCGGINHGQDVDIAAPGVDVLSTAPGGGYDRKDGTSMATPHVAGVAALLAQSDATFRGWALWARLLQMTQRLDHPARDVGKGLLQTPLRGTEHNS